MQILESSFGGLTVNDSKNDRKMFNKHPVKSVTITVCMTCLIIAYLLFGSGLINWSKINETCMQVVAQYEEQLASKLEENTVVEPDDNLDKTVEANDTQVADEDNQLKSVNTFIASVMCSVITLLELFVAIALLVYALRRVLG